MREEGLVSLCYSWIYLTPPTTADFLFSVLRNYGAVMRKASDEKAVQRAQRTMLPGLVRLQEFAHLS